MKDNKIFCSKCGNTIRQNEKFCPKCGTHIDAINNDINFIDNTVMTNSQDPQNFNWLTIIGIICSLVSIFIFWWLSLLGLSLELQALKDIKEKNEKGKNLAVMGISMCITVLIIMLIGIIMRFA